MKKTLLLFFFSVFFLNAPAQTSVYHPFPDSGAYWNQNQWWTNSICHYDKEFTNFFGGDTVINSKVYHKIMESGYVYSPDCGGFNYFYSYSFAIRQDTSLKKVWICDGSGVEAILYDFNLHMGDTLDSSKVRWGFVGSGEYIVTSIDSILINGQYRNKYNYRSAQYASLDTCIIEGIGNISGLISAPSYFEVQGGLHCFKQNGRTLYPDSTNSCNMINVVNNISLNNISLSISPNPATEKITLSGYSFSGKEVVEVYNVMGELQTTNYKPQTEVDVSSLAAGVYVVVVRDGEKSFRSKFIIQ